MMREQETPAGHGEAHVRNWHSLDPDRRDDHDTVAHELISDPDKGIGAIVVFDPSMPTEPPAGTTQPIEDVIDPAHARLVMRHADPDEGHREYRPLEDLRPSV